MLTSASNITYNKSFFKLISYHPSGHLQRKELTWSMHVAFAALQGLPLQSSVLISQWSPSNPSGQIHLKHQMWKFWIRQYTIPPQILDWRNHMNIQNPFMPKSGRTFFSGDFWILLQTNPVNCIVNLPSFFMQLSVFI